MKEHNLSPKLLAEGKHLYQETDMPLNEIKRFLKWSGNTNELIDILSPREDGLECPFCQMPMMIRVTRSSTSRPYCPNCNHQLSAYCTCQNCRQTRESEIYSLQQRQIQNLAQKEAMLEKTWLKPVAPVDFYDFETEHKISTCILLSWKGLRLDGSGKPYITNIFAQREDIFPTIETTYRIFQELLSLNILRIDKDISNAGLEAFDEKTCSIQGLSAFTFRFNLIQNDSIAINEIQATCYWLKYEEFVFWWRWIALEEAKSYYYYLTGKNDPVGKRTEETWAKIIEDGSLALCKYVIRYSLETIKKWPSPPPGKYTNVFLRTCRMIANKILSGEWEHENKPYRYIFHSTATSYIFNKVLLIGTEGVFRPISDAHAMYETIREKMAYENGT